MTTTPAAVAVLALLTCGPVVAAPPPKTPAPTTPSGEGPDVFGGYSFIHAGAANLNGWHLSGSYPAWRSLCVVADLSGHYGDYAGADLSQLEAMVGGRRYWRWKGFRPFAEFLVGAVRHSASVGVPEGVIESSGTDLAVTPGFGADYPLTEAWAARATFDLLLVHGGGWEADPRVSLGVAYRFGSR